MEKQRNFYLVKGWIMGPFLSLLPTIIHLFS